MSSEDEGRAAPTFYGALDRFGSAPALIDAVAARTVSYTELDTMVEMRAGDLGRGRQLIFLEAAASVESIVTYLAALRSGHVVHLMDRLEGPHCATLVERYRPTLLMRGSEVVGRRPDSAPPMHEDLGVLLSTSGSTGSPRFVKLSRRNLVANAGAIADYLGLSSDDRALAYLKPHYSFGLSIINSHLSCGAALILSTASTTEPAFGEQLRRFAATSFSGVPYTFEALEQAGFRLADYPALRHVAQAGGRLAPERVKAWARSCREHGVRFFVMYGQTEAAPRIAYLPPELAEDHPDAIGRPVPGGSLSILGADGAPIEVAGSVGEVAYSGPNVMMGYADGADDLAADETPPLLRTGDLGYRDRHGLYHIVGRASRFVKPLGLRISLDAVQDDVRVQVPGAIVTGDDERIVVAVPAGTEWSGEALARHLKVPRSMVAEIAYDQLPTLSSGKPDYRTILADAVSASGGRGEPPAEGREGRPALMRLWDLVKGTLGLDRPGYSSVLELFRGVLDRPGLDEKARAAALSIDSLAFVELAVGLEHLFEGAPPEDWMNKTIEELEGERLLETLE